MSRPSNINVFQWNRACFFLRHVELNSKFIVTTTDEVTMNRPKKDVGFSVIFCHACYADDQQKARRNTCDCRFGKKEASAVHLLRTHALFMLWKRKIILARLVGYYGDSECSLITSLVCPFLLAVRVRRRSLFSRGSFDRVFRGVIVRCAIRQCQSRATPRDGNSRQPGGYQELHGEWRMRIADELSTVHQNQEVWGIEKTSANLPGIASGPHNGVEPGSIGRAQSGRASSMTLIPLLMSRRQAAPLKSPAIKYTFSSSITARIVRYNFFPTPIFGVVVVDVASASSVVSANWDSTDPPWISPLRSSLLTFYLRLQTVIHHLSGRSTLPLHWLFKVNIWCIQLFQVFQVWY